MDENTASGSQSPTQSIVELPQDISEEKSGKLCEVCGSGRASSHYGAITCGSCKIFFLRAVFSKGPFACENKATCKLYTTKCRHCRYLKCLSAGMQPTAVGRKEGVMKRWKPVQSFAHNRTPSELSVVPYLTNDHVTYADKFTEIVKSEFDVQRLARALVELERYCDSDNGSRIIDPNFRYELDIPLQEALQHPKRLCDRTPIGIESSPILPPDPSDVYRSLFCRVILHYIDWLRATEEVTILSDYDRLALCRGRCSSMALLFMLHNTYKVNCDGLKYCHGIGFQKPEVPNEFDTFTVFLIEYSQKNVIKVFREVNLTEEEFVFLKKILFFTTGPILSEMGNEIVRQARTKYEMMFLKYLQATVHSSKVSSRITNIMSVVPHILYLSMVDDAYFGRLAALNINNMRGKLTYTTSSGRMNIVLDELKIDDMPMDDG